MVRYLLNLFIVHVVYRLPSRLLRINAIIVWLVREHVYIFSFSCISCSHPLLVHGLCTRYSSVYITPVLFAAWNSIVQISIVLYMEVCYSIAS